ncbi:DUF4302 domain-containing protein [Sphingobacterium sp. SRCM116780]|uniref:DUF4302 domain-containing protein n=1 Tax=Sphingobacterium sp. SRCM116780 TaxID=2907623 RepID=UPI001F2190C1|nr:DUF4302 domain-containing protein [Sphingobacterium sp. SRCM116780]UIR56266.1 DUF4302 domain-containing protein [Sphingobacterium sp. SRCM116780]
MKRKSIFILFFGLLLLNSSCDKKRDRFFEDNPTERLNESVNNAYQILKSQPNGWIMQYYPSGDLEYGGYNLFTKFTSNEKVEFQADYIPNFIESDYSKQVSTYKVYPSAGPILTFDTFNEIIHFFGLPGAYTDEGAVDSGTKGDFEFLVLKATADSVILQGRKTLNRIVMLPIKSNPEVLIKKYQDNAAKFDAFFEYAVEVGGKSYAAYIYSNLNRAFVFDDPEDENIYSYVYTENGLEFYKEFSIKGVKVKKMTYVAPTAAYPDGYFENPEKTVKYVPVG